MKIFISQPMCGRTDKEIKAERNKIEKEFTEEFENPEFVDSFFEGSPHEENPLYYLGKSLQLLSTADGVYFADGWEDSRGCKIEHACATLYKVPIID